MKKATLFILAAMICTISCRDLFEKDISERKVEVISPQDKVTAEEGETVFLWKQVESATEYYLTIVSPTFNKASKVIADTLMPDSILNSYSFVIDLEAGKYQWNIRARNSAYTTVDQIFSLTVEAKVSDDDDDDNDDGDDDPEGEEE